MREVENQKVILADIHKNQYSKGYSLVTRECPYCGKKHNHGAGEGHRVVHCMRKKSEAIRSSGGYVVVIDWSSKSNRELKKEYEAYLKKLTK